MDDVSAAEDHLVYDSHDPANLNYDVSRLSSYYADDQRVLALLVLDTLAHQPTRAPVPDLLNLCKHRDPSLTAEQVRGALTVLAEDRSVERARCPTGMACDSRWPLVKKSR